MAPNPANPSPTLAALVTAGPTICGSVGAREVRLFELPESSSNFISAYLFSLNKVQLSMFLRDPMVTFDALCSAMNEALPQGIGLFAATYCWNSVFESTPQFAVFEIVDTCSVFARTVMMQAPRISFTGTSSSTSLVVGLNSTEEGRQTSCSRPAAARAVVPVAAPAAAPLLCQHAHLVPPSPSSPKSVS